MKQTELKHYIRKLVKEAIEEETIASKTKPKLEVKKNKLTKESVQKYSKIFENRKALIESMISEKGLMDKLGGMLGKSNPSLDVDNAKYVKRELDKAIATASAAAEQFSKKALNSSREINAFHDVVLAALEKFVSLSGSLKIDGSDQVDAQLQDEYEKKVLGVARNFYQLLNNEKGRIESYAKTLLADLEDKGYHKSMVTSPLPKPPAAKEPAGLDRSKLKQKNPPQKSIAQSAADMATSWIK